MRCPECNSSDAYIGLKIVECINPDCKHFKKIDTILLDDCIALIGGPENGIWINKINYREEWNKEPPPRGWIKWFSFLQEKGAKKIIYQDIGSSWLKSNKLYTFEELEKLVRDNNSWW